MDIYHHVTTSSYEFESTSGRSVIPRRLPPVPSLFSPTHSHSPSTSSSSSSSIFSVSPSTSPGGSRLVSPLTSSSPNQSPTKVLNALKRVSRPLPQIPAPRHTHSPSLSQAKPSQTTQLIVCRNCMICITAPESLFPSSAVPPGSRAFRGFSGKASLFMEVCNVTSTPPRVQLMTTGAHTMQETFCANCSGYLGWKIVKAHEWSEKWKEGQWLLELENLWLARSSDALDSGFEMVGEREREREWMREKEPTGKPRVRRGSDLEAAQEYPQDALGMVTAAREQGLGLEFVYSETRGIKDLGFLQSPPSHRYNKSVPNFRAYGTKSATHLPMTVVS